MNMNYKIGAVIRWFDKNKTDCMTMQDVANLLYLAVQELELDNDERCHLFRYYIIQFGWDLDRILYPT